MTRARPEDLWESGLLLEASYGGIRIDLLETDNDETRALARHTFVRRDGARLEDGGNEPFVCRAQLVFTRTGPNDNPHERFAFFRELKDGQAHVFVHPIRGRYN